MKKISYANEDRLSPSTANTQLRSPRVFVNRRPRSMARYSHVFWKLESVVATNGEGNTENLKNLCVP